MRVLGGLLTACGFAVVVSSAASGCGMGMGKGSCDRRSVDATCSEALTSNVGYSMESACKTGFEELKPGTWSRHACDRAGAIAACETKSDRTWYFAGGKTTAQIAVQCAAWSGTLLDGNGKPTH